MPAQGFGIVQGDEILVDTVSSTERAAKVNWLVVYANQELTFLDTDDYISMTWARCRKDVEPYPECVPVTISVAAPN